MHGKIAKRLNQQVNMEFFSAYLYLDMANYYTGRGLEGFANWFRVQAREELDHGLRFMVFLQDKAMPVALGEIPSPAVDYHELWEPLEAAYNHELAVTKAIGALYSEAAERQEYDVMHFVGAFFSEQTEEEKIARTLLERGKLYGGQKQSLYLLDQELKGRVYQPAGRAAQQ